MKPFFRKKNADPIVEEIAQTVQDAQYEAVTPEPENVAPVNRKLPLTHRTSAKFVAFLLVIIMVIVLSALQLVRSSWWKKNSIRHLNGLTKTKP